MADLEFFYSGDHGAFVRVKLNAIVALINAGGAGGGGTGWSPVLAVASDGERRCWQISDWVGGTGTKPATGYVGASGIVADISDAVDVRGPAGGAGPANSLSIGTVQSGETADATITGEAPSQTLNLTLPVGDAGTNGWTPVLAADADGERRVLRVLDWQGGTGTKPETGYLGASGIVATAALALDVRGPAGSGSVSTVNGKDPDGSGNVELTPADIGAVATGALAAVATSGSYDDLSGKPTIPTLPTAVTQAIAELGVDTTVRGWSALRVRQAINARVSAAGISGEYMDLLNRPAAMSQAEAEAGTATTPRLISADVLLAAILANSSSGGASNGMRFFGPGTHTLIAPASTIYVTACAGGANGNDYGGGGGGAFFVRRAFTVTKGASYSITVGGRGQATSIASLFTLAPGTVATSVLGGRGGAESTAGTGGVASRGGHGALVLDGEGGGGSLGGGGGISPGGISIGNLDATIRGGDGYPTLLSSPGSPSLIPALDTTLLGGDGGYGAGGAAGPTGGFPGDVSVRGQGAGGPGAMIIEWD